MESTLAAKFALLRLRIEAETQLGSVILITSAKAGDGTSLTAFGLADSLMNADHRVLLVDSVSGPRDERSADAANAEVCRTSLASLAIDEALLRVEQSGLRERISAFVGRTREEFDYTIIDGGQLMSDSVSLLLGGIVDAILISIVYGRPPSEADKIMVEALGYLRTRVLGVVSTSSESIAAFGREPALGIAGTSALSLASGTADAGMPPILRWLALRGRILLGWLRRTIRFDNPYP